MNFGDTIRQLRISHSLTQRELADRLQAMNLDASFTYVSKIENGRLETLPSEELIRGLAKILETDAEELLTLAGKFNSKALQEVVSEIPEAGVLLRRLQSKQINKAQIQRINDFLNKESSKKDDAD